MDIQSLAVWLMDASGFGWKECHVSDFLRKFTKLPIIFIMSITSSVPSFQPKLSYRKSIQARSNADAAVNDWSP